jgi:DNA-binding Lrp family transcriptional regulator
MKHRTYAEAAEELGVPETWLKRRIKELPHRKFGEHVRFADEDMAEISAMYAVRPAAEAPQDRQESAMAALADLRPERARRSRASA